MAGGSVPAPTAGGGIPPASGDMEVCGDKATTLATRVASLMDLCGMYALAGKKKEKSACWWASKSTYRDERLLVVTFPRATGEGTNDRGAASGAASTVTRWTATKLISMWHYAGSEGTTGRAPTCASLLAAATPTMSIEGAATCREGSTTGLLTLARMLELATTSPRHHGPHTNAVISALPEAVEDASSESEGKATPHPI